MTAFLMQYGGWILIGIAGVCMLAALFLPESKQSDRFFGLGAASAGRAKRVIAAVRSLGDESRMVADPVPAPIASVDRTTESAVDDGPHLDDVDDFLFDESADDEELEQQHARVADDERAQPAIVRTEVSEPIAAQPADEEAISQVHDVDNVAEPPSVIKDDVVGETGATKVFEEAEPDRSDAGGNASEAGGTPEIESKTAVGTTVTPTSPAIDVVEDAAVKEDSAKSEAGLEEIQAVDEPRRDTDPSWLRLLQLSNVAPSASERVAIVQTLGVLGDASYSPLLAEILESETDASVRIAALEAIRRGRLTQAAAAVEDVISYSQREGERLIAVNVADELDLIVALAEATADECVAVAAAATSAIERRRESGELPPRPAAETAAVTAAPLS